MTVVRGVATIPIKGILSRCVSGIEKSCGVTDYTDICEDLDECMTDETIEAILLWIDSPGGSVSGLYECAACVAELAAVKPVVAFTDGQMASAAYFLACPANAIVATPSATVGSVGVILQLLDDVDMWKLQGIKVETIQSDELKGTGASGTRLTPLQREYLQAMVDEAATRFKGTVMQNRGSTVEAYLDGRLFSADAAATAGLIDEVVEEIEEAYLLLK